MNDGELEVELAVRQIVTGFKALVRTMAVSLDAPQKLQVHRRVSATAKTGPCAPRKVSGAAVRAHRRDKHMTQAELAVELVQMGCGRCSQALVSMIERDQAPSVASRMHLELARALGVSVEQLYQNGGT